MDALTTNTLGKITILCVVLFAGMLLCFHLGRLWGRRQDGTGDSNDAGTTTGTIFALLGLLVAFLFSGAYSRFEGRRDIIVQEANAIGTVYLRVDLLPQVLQPAFRAQMREYTLLRGDFFNQLQHGRKEVNENLAQTTRLQTEIWHQAVVGSSGPEYNSARMLLIPALNEMFDIASTRTDAVKTHPPPLIFYTLMGIALLCAWMGGYAARKSPRSMIIHSAVFAFAIAMMVYLIADIEFPSQGWVNLSQVNQTIVDMAASMK